MFWHDRKTIPAKDTKIGDVIIATHPTETSTVMGPEYTVIKKQVYTADSYKAPQGKDAAAEEKAVSGRDPVLRK